jgi:small GTP-binding protein
MAAGSGTCMHMKVCVSGCSNAGKSSLITRIVTNAFFSNIPTTIGIDYQTKSVVTSHGITAAIIFQDLAGQERFKSVCMTTYRNVDAVLVVFDLKNGVSGNNDDVPYWIDMARQAAKDNVPILLVANKIDEATTPNARARGRALHGVDENVEARAYSGRIYYVSAKTGAGVDAVVKALCDIMETSDRYHEVASEAAVHAASRTRVRADNDDNDYTPSIPDPLLTLVTSGGAAPRIVKAPRFITLVGGDPAIEPGSSPILKSSVSRLHNVKSLRVSDSGGCAC